MTEIANAKGCLLGLACGDALGRPVEFKSAEEIASQHGEVTEMLGDGTHGQPPGTITDDTEMALCIAESLVDRRGFDPADVADRFVDWLDSDPFDIGLMTRDSLSQIRQGTSWDDAGADVWESRPEGSNAGNGSVMRCAPHAIAFAEDLDTLIQVSKESSAITHYDPRCTYGCAVLNCTIAGYLRDVEDPLEMALDQVQGDAPDELVESLRFVPDMIDESQLETSGYVMHTLQTALYDAMTAETAEDAIVTAVNRGGDTDTIGAVTGALAGARFGSNSLPERWLDTVDKLEELELLAQALVMSDLNAST